MQNKLETIRKTKLDLARWLASGIENCGNTETSLLLARYAAAQLEGAALIPRRTSTLRPVSSLLRSALQKSSPPSGQECLRLLQQVSRAILGLLRETTAAPGISDLAIKRIIRHELQTAKMLTQMLPRSAAA